MRQLARRFLLLVPCGAIVWLLLGGGMSSGDQPPAGDLYAARDPDTFLPPALGGGDDLTRVHRLVGTGSCAASNCHGAEAGPRSPVGSEYTIWTERDPHAQAYAALFNDESRLIIENLRSSPLYAAVKEAHQEQLCLNCHATTAPQSQLAQGHRHAAADGVGCESCHGAAEDWVARHVRPDWQFLSPDEKANYGFRNTDDVLARTRACADCHVGSEGRDVNHDLIAAGHPRLNFEMAAYHAKYPAHWNRNEDRRQNAVGDPNTAPRAVTSYLEAKLWAVGQVVQAEKALDLLVQRATHESAPWPEFTEYGCFACHHDLQAASLRRQVGYGGRRPGSYPWGTWNYALLPALAEQSKATVDLTSEGSTFLELEGEMSRFLPDRRRAAGLAAELRDELGEWGRRLSADDLDAADVRRLLTGFAERREELTPQGWDSAAQLWLAVTALNQARVDLEGRLPPARTAADIEIIEALRAARGELEFPVAAPAGAGERVIRYDSPQNYSPEKVEAVNRALGRVHEIVAGE